MQTRQVKVGNVLIGGDAPISIQTMGKTPMIPENFETIRSELVMLKTMGCQIIRYAVPTMDVIETLTRLCNEHILPIVADIHFDYKLALAAIQAGVDKVRVNPGNIGADWKLKEVLQACSDKGLPIRVGINSGSLDRKYKDLPRQEAMIASAEEEINLLEQANFKDVVFSLKSSNTQETIAANEIFAAKYDIPLHLGVTEAGPLLPSLVKSSVALSRLIDKGIGNTIRISISGEPATEIKAAREILKACGKLNRGANLVSCPKCGRATFDSKNLLAQKLENYLYTVDKNITVAVMGCLVNGPGEAKEADLGVTGLGNNVVIFKHGEILKKITPEMAFDTLVEEINKL